MKKGRFGLVLCFYPIAAFVGVILKQPLLCCALLALAVFVERDQWTSRQTLQAALLSALVLLFDKIVPWVSSLFSPIPYLSSATAFVATLLGVLVYAAAVVFSILGILRVMKEQEANLPLFSELAYQAFGQQKPKPVPAWQQYPPQGYQQTGQTVSQSVSQPTQPEQKQP